MAEHSPLWFYEHKLLQRGPDLLLALLPPGLFPPLMVRRVETRVEHVKCVVKEEFLWTSTGATVMRQMAPKPIDMDQNFPL